MRRSPLALFLATLVLATLTTPPTFAQGVNLYWNECGASPGAVVHKTFACDSNTGPPFTMVVSVFPPAEMPQFVAVEALIDVAVSGSSLPAWWQTASGQCRAGALSAAFDPGMLSTLACLDIWDGAQAISIYQVTSPYAGSFRFKLAGAIPGPSPITAEEVGQELVVGLIRIARTKTVGVGACSGCLIGACFVASQVTLIQANGAGDWTLTNPATNSWVYFQGSGGGVCEVPATNRTWGAIKAQYR